MAGKESPERLPIGWTELIAAKDGEELKFYCNIITGQKFYCKADLLQYIEFGTPSQGTRQKKRAKNEGNSENTLTQAPTETNNNPDWLPQGWIMESKATMGRKYKVYTDPSTGRRFFSKPEVLRYLNSDKDIDHTSEQTKMAIGSDNNLHIVESIGAETPQKPEGSKTLKEKMSSNSSGKKIEIKRCAAEGLPEGWIKEIKIERTGNKIRKDSYYTDPESKYVFRSVPDALRFVETKDIKACAFKPKKREELKFLSDDTFLPMGESIVTETPQKPEGSKSWKEIISSNSRQKKIEILSCAAEGLPQGWIKDVKIERRGSVIRKDPYYTDPDSKYVFRSIPDALRYMKTKDLKSCAMKPKKREELKFLNDDTSISEEKQSLDNTTKEYTEKEENIAPSISPPPKTPVSKRKRGRPVASPSTDNNNNIIQNKKSAEVTIDSTKSEGEKDAARDNNDVEIERKSDENLKPGSEFAFKALRGDIPVEANNLAAQGYNHRERASANVGLPSFSDFARRKI